MSSPHRIFGAEMSPYSVKVRSYFRYKGIPQQWIVRNMETQAEYQKYAKLPIVPLVVTPEGEGVQDSTPIIERLEAAYPEPSIHPGDPVAAFVSPQIESSFRDTIALLDAHLGTRPYLFGGRPAFGDFGLFAQLYEAWTDPTPGALIEGCAQRVLDWVHRMLWPRAEGDFEAWSSLEPTLLPLLERQVGRLFLPWSVANAGAIAAGKEEFRVELDGRGWTQKPQKYHAKSLAALRAKYVAARGAAGLEAILERAGCLAGLRREGGGA